MTLAKINGRHGTTAQWTAANPILAKGEPGMDDDTGDVRWGDGVHTWSALPSRLPAAIVADPAAIVALNTRYVTPPVWTAYTPVLKWGGTPGGIGANDSRWCRIGKMVFVEVAVQYNGGTGLLTISRPVVGRPPTLPSTYVKPLGTYLLFDISSGAIYPGVVTSSAADGSDIVLRSMASPSVTVTNTIPFLQAGGDEIYATFEYEALV